MNSKKSLVQLAAVAALLIGAAWWLTREAGRDNAGAAYLCPKMEGAKPALLQITPAAGATWQAELKGDQWRLAALDGYPADGAALAQFVYRLSGAQCDAEKTALAGNHAKLGLAEPGTGEGAGTRVCVKDAQGTVLADVVLGRGAAEGGLFVRRHDETQTWLSREAPAPPQEALDWVNRQLAAAQADGFKKLSLAAPMAQTLTLDTPPAEPPPPGTPGEKQADKPGEQAAPYPWKADAVRRMIGALGWAQFDAVKSDAKASDMGLPTVLRFMPADPAQHETIEAELWPDGADQAWMRLKAIPPPPPPPPPAPIPILDKDKPPPPPAPMPPGIESARQKNAAWNGWLFKVGGDLGFAARQTAATLAKETPKPENTANAPTPAASNP